MDNTLNRFLDAQAEDYQTALAEIKSGKKKSHWMWYIFPQIKGLGQSETSKRYAIMDMQEAQNYLDHPVLGRRLIEISSKLLKLDTNDAYSIFGSPDDLKLKSCMTLFSLVDGAPAVFKMVLAKFFNGQLDEKTIELVKK